VPRSRVLPTGTLSGTWQVASGAKFQIEDDSTSLKVSLISSSSIRELSGTLTRRDKKPDSKFFDGTLYGVFGADRSKKRRALRTMGILLDQNHLRLRFIDWPSFSGNGTYLGMKPFTDILERISDSNSSGALRYPGEYSPFRPN